MLRPVQIIESARDGVPGDELRLFNNGLKEPSSNDFETLFGAGRAPRRLYAPDRIAESIERCAPALSAYFNIVRLRMRRASRIRSRQADDKQAVARELR
jgi:hypothetical protein